MPTPTNDEVRALLEEYAGHKIDGDLSTCIDWQHPQQPVAARITYAGQVQDYLIHQPYTVETVEEGQFTSFPPTYRRGY